MNYMEATAQNILVVTELDPRVKHSTIFERFDDLKTGENLIIHNDHDPKPLFYQLQAKRGDTFEWEYLENGPELWKIKITKTANSLEVLNATLIEPRLKHATIFKKFDDLKPGEAFILLNDHDPKPLYYQLSQMWGDIFTWQYIQQGPYEFRILITKKPLQTEPKQEEKNTYTTEGDNILNVTLLEPRVKHPTIFQRFDELKPGQCLTIQNDHDPKPLYYQMIAERGDIFTWEYLEQGPEWWKIKIAKKLTGPADETLGEIVAKDIRNAEVFNQFGLDFCCNGYMTIKEVCAQKGVDVGLVENALKESDKTKGSNQRPLPYNEWELDFLTDYIVNTHHSYVRKVMPNLKMYAAKVAKVHGERHAELYEIDKLVQETMDEMLEHSDEEEKVLFPYIKKLVREKLDGDNVKSQIDLRVQEHKLVGDNMDKIREISNNYALPEDSCASYSFLFKSLDEFEEDLHIHIHLENNILFPKAIKLEKEISLKNQS